MKYSPYLVCFITICAIPPNWGSYSDRGILTNSISQEILTSEEYLETSSDDENPDIHLSTPELIKRYGYPAENHYITTEDGYILNVHRIPHGRNGWKYQNSKKIGKKWKNFKNFQNFKKNSGNRKIAFLQHGLTSSSSDWLMQNPDKALPYKLAEAGYDVWLGNARGNMYSQNHTNLSPDSYKFWRFSWDEMGRFDIPAVIDYILRETGQNDLYYIGHSMGTTMFWTFMSTHPEYAPKIRFMAGLGPAAYLSHETGIAKVLSEFSFEEQIILDVIGHGILIPSYLNKLLMKYDPQICSPDMRELNICENVVFLVSGYDRDQMNLTELPVILGHTPAPASSRSLIHYLQIIKSGIFRQYDYGRFGNMAVYGQYNPPEYDLSKAKVPTALFWGENDQLCDPEDVQILASKLPQVVSYFKVNFTQFNHVDFLFAIEADKLVYDPLMKLMLKY